MLLEVLAMRLVYDEQLPHERYSLPAICAQKLLMLTAPPPLCWTTLSDAASRYHLNTPGECTVA
jgi:hypothetical protein